SVVIMALAASSHGPGAARDAKPSITVPNLRASSGSPITPVEARRTCCGRQPSAAAASSAVSLTACRPFLPVNALALPALTTSPRAVPVGSLLRHHSTGADAH